MSTKKSLAKTEGYCKWCSVGIAKQKADRRQAFVCKIFGTSWQARGAEAPAARLDAKGGPSPQRQA